MAAGAGSRFGGPKQLVPVGPDGETLTDYAVYDAWRAGIRRAVFVVRRETEKEFHEALGRKYGTRLEVAYVPQELDLLPPGVPLPAGRSKPWGTGHAVLAAKGAMRGPFVAVNADDWYGAEGFEKLAAFLSAPAAPPPVRWALVAHRLKNTLSGHGSVARGVCEVGRDGRLLSIREYTDVREAVGKITGRAPAGELRRFTGADPVSLNFWGFTPDLFDVLETDFARFLRERGGDPAAEYYLPAGVDAALTTGRAEVIVLETAERWFGVTYREDLPGVRKEIARRVAAGLYPRPLWS